MNKSLTYLLYTCLISLLTFYNSFAQKNYVVGYIINPSGDTIKGFIDDQNWERNPDFIHFKTNINSETQRFSANHLSGFVIKEGEAYHTSIITIDKTPTRFEELLRDSRPKLVADTVFLLELVKGKISLNILVDETFRNHLYVKRENGNNEELIQRNYLATKNGHQMLGTFNQYKDQLRYSYLTDCAVLLPQIIKLPYTKNAVKSLIEEYNTCASTTIQIKAKPKTQGKEFKFFTLGGANITKYTFQGEEATYLTDTNYEWHPNLMFGLALQIKLPRNRQKWSVYNELTWKKNYSKSQYDFNKNFVKENGLIQIKTSYIGLTSMIRYAWLHDNWQSFINAGFAFNRTLKADVCINTHANYYNMYEKDYNELIYQNNRKKLEVGLAGGGGIAFKKYTAELRYERADGFLNLMHVSARKNMLMFLISYAIN